MEDNSVFGLDIAKNVFHVCEMNGVGKIVLSKRLYRDEVLEFFANCRKGIVALESCGSSSYWAREIAKLGHKVRLIAAQYVKPFVKSQKNDAVDAEAIAEAANRPTMRFVSPNTLEQQDIQSIHRLRQRFVKQRTALCCQARGLLLEYGITIPQGRCRVASRLREILLSSSHAERSVWRQVIEELRSEIVRLDQKISEYDKLIDSISANHPVCQKLETLPGVGPITATAIVAAVGNPQDFQNGRQFSAWLGLVPRQHSTGGKTILRGITKQGDKYIRTLLVHGARMEVRFATKRNNHWLLSLKERRGYNRAAIAQANKSARRIWATLAKAS